MTGSGPRGPRRSGERRSGESFAGAREFDPAGLAGIARGLGPLGALVLAASAWLLAPVWDAPEDGRAASQPRVHALIVDVSPSVTLRRPDYADAIRARLSAAVERAAEQAADVLLVAFDAQARRVLGPAPAGELRAALEGRGRDPLDPTAWSADAPDAAGSASRLDAALELVAPFVDPRAAAGAGSAAAGRPAGRILVLGDGTFTGADPHPRLSALRAAGVELESAAVGLPRLADAALVALDLPARVEPGAELAAWVEVTLDPGTRRLGSVAVELQIAVADANGRRELPPRRLELNTAQRIAPPPSAAGGAPTLATWRPSVGLGPAAGGRTRVTGRVRLLGTRDPVAANDRLSADVAAEGVLVVGIVDAGERARGGAEPWRAACAEAGVQALVLGAGDWGNAADALDVLVTLDVPLADIDGQALDALLARGAGWLHVGGWEFLGHVTPAWERRLALVPDRGDGEPRDVALLVDGSGSMAGEPFDRVRAAALTLVRAAPARDAVELAFFTVRRAAGYPLKASGSFADTQTVVDAAAKLLSARSPRGSTDVLGALEQVAAERAGAEREGLVFLLTDGRQTFPTTRVEERARAVRGSLAASRTELRVIAVGADADRAFLERFLDPGESLLEAQNLERLGELFQQEVNRERTRSGAPLALVAAGRGPLVERAFAGAPDPPRRLLRCVLARPAGATAEVAWSTAAGEPVLAIARRGLGAAATLATRAQSGWTGEPLELTRRMLPLLRFLGSHERATLPSLRWSGERLVLEGWTAAELPRGRWRSGGAWSADAAPWSLATTAGGLRLAGTWESPRWAAGGPELERVRFVAGGEELSLAVPERVLAEHWPRAARLRELPTASPRAGPGAAGLGRRSHPAGVWVLLLGLGLVFVYGWRGGR